MKMFSCFPIFSQNRTFVLGFREKNCTASGGLAAGAASAAAAVAGGPTASAGFGAFSGSAIAEN